jgi:hypothetical protein
MLLNKIHKQHLNLCQTDIYATLPCAACSGLLSNLDIIYDTIQSNGYQNDKLLEQWLSEWMYNFSNLLYFSKMNNKE